MNLPGNGTSHTLNIVMEASSKYAGGYIQRKHLDTREVEIWCAPDSVQPASANGTARRISSPDDIIFDAQGGFWFTDWGNATEQAREITAVYYVPKGSRTPKAVVPARSAPNGIGLSPAGDRLYVSETYSRWVVYWDLSGRGEIKSHPPIDDGSRILSGAIYKAGILDSLRLDEEGNVYAATMLPEGNNPLVPGGIAVISPAGETLEYIELPKDFPEPLPSNICFGGTDRKTAFITCGGTGRILSCQMRIPGLAPAFPH